LLDKGYVGWKEIELALPHNSLPAQPLQSLPLDEIPTRINGGKLHERLRLLTRILQDGPTLVLFPEVSLLKRYQQHFPQALPFHGEMTAELRRQEFKKRRGESGLSLPPSSLQHGSGQAVLLPPIFATFQGLPLPFTPQRIVVVEESAEAYKLSAGSRANTVHLAQLRAKLLGIPLTYLSLVPSAEVVEQEGLTFPTPAPRLHLLNLGDERGWPITGAAVAVLRQVQEKHRQAVVLVHRRGYSAVLRCKQCEWKAMCPNCSLPLRYHRGSSRLVMGSRAGSLVCHQCGHEAGAPKLCPKCHSDVFEPKGPGVEWVLDALKEHLPGLPRYRYSADAKDDLTPLLQGEPGVLVGTTAALRGPVLPELAVVLLPYADGFVLDSDFRAEERYHRLLWQLTELHPGRRPLLVLQTFEPGHAVHLALQAGNVQERVRFEMGLRRLLHYPPVLRMIKLEVSHAKEPAARDAAIQVANYLNSKAQPNELLGPAPAPMARVKAQYVFHLLLRGSTERLRDLMVGLPHPRGARLRIDPDPQSFVGLLED
jgi:primosomal protein N' (replication factor Y)